MYWCPKCKIAPIFQWLHLIVKSRLYTESTNCHGKRTLMILPHNIFDMFFEICCKSIYFPSVCQGLRFKQFNSSKTYYESRFESSLLLQAMFFSLDNVCVEVGALANFDYQILYYDIWWIIHFTECSLIGLVTKLFNILVSSNLFDWGVEKLHKFVDFDTLQNV